ncbi:Enoyl-(Acyl carrier protein) reductase [Paraburkholderia aspalathi]|uniref:Enoyl-(Acyl carrier protein) reductase n=1 Tax=Paraburkholderia aspalathi TaxID=1324617 RepID=A0A1I7EPQ4_9BURK|nr:Enoyl-(Acyl carrier protein) reductase [Paraburkholderia aspalathi]
MNAHPVVLITGALTGIGCATALAFAQDGSRADVRREDDVRSIADKTVEWFGRLDVAVNNADTEGHPDPLTQQSAETYATTFDTNVLGTILSLPRLTTAETDDRLLQCAGYQNNPLPHSSF